jgi:hypothetical protein
MIEISNEYKLLHKGLWMWLAANPDKWVMEYPMWTDAGGELFRPYNSCYLCEAVIQNDPDKILNCQTCPMYVRWGQCELEASPISKYRKAYDRGDHELVHMYATIVANFFDGENHGKD